MAKDLFGVVAVRKGLASESEVDVALEAQRDNEGRAPLIGEILVDMGTLTPEAVHTVLAEQGGSMAPQAAAPTGPRLIQRSGPPVKVNGASPEGPCTIGPGDRVEIGGAVFVLEGVSIQLVGPAVDAASSKPTTRVPMAAVSPTASTTQLPAPPPVAAASAPAPAEPAKESPFKKVDALIARILPSVHNHRKYLALALLPGLFAVVLPWRLAAEQRWVFGIQGPGWATFFCTAFALAVALFGPRPQALLKPEKITILSLTALALLLSLWKLFFPPAYAMAIGLGLPLAALSAIAATLAVALAESKPGVLADTAFGLAGRAARDLSGKRGKEKAAAVEKRDELLRQLGEAALETKGGPAADLDAAAKAKAALEEARKTKSPLKPLEGKLRRALQKLGRNVVDQNLPLDGRTLPSAEIKDLDAKIKELG